MFTSNPAAVIASTAVDVEFGSSPPNDCHAPRAGLTGVREVHEAGLQVGVRHRHVRGDERLDRGRGRVDVRSVVAAAVERPAAARLLRVAEVT